MFLVHFLKGYIRMQIKGRDDIGTVVAENSSAKIEVTDSNPGYKG